MVVPAVALMAVSCSNSDRVIIGANPSDGSSNSSNEGRSISARAMASICCSPPLRLPAVCERRSPSTGKVLKPLLHVGPHLGCRSER